MKAIGIDLGTTNSVICKYDRGETNIVKVAGASTIPSVVYIKNDEVIVGSEAKKRMQIDPENCLSSTKRHIGGSWGKKIEGKSYSPTDTAAMILKYIKSELADVSDVVITIPAIFNEEERKQTKLAAETAGFNVLKLLTEPTAAAISYGIDKEKDQTILVLDLGGGTFDVTLLKVTGNKFEQISTVGDSQLGGDDFDWAIVDFCLARIKEESGKDLSKDSVARFKLKEIAEQVKIALASSKKTSIETLLPDGSQLDIDGFSRNDLQKLIQPLLDKITSTTQEMLDQRNISIDDVNRIVLVGGSCKHPLVQEAIKEKLKAPFLADNMDTAVAEGAALVCANILMPSEGKRSASDPIESGRDDNTSVNTEFEFSEVVPHSLGIDMMDNSSRFGFGRKLLFVPIIMKDTKYPCKGAVLGATEKTQEKIEMNVYRGENQDLSQNEKIGDLELKVPSEYILKVSLLIAAIFDIDSNGILTFTSVGMPANIGTEQLKMLAKSAEANQQRVDVDTVLELKKEYGFIEKTEIIKQI